MNNGITIGVVKKSGGNDSTKFPTKLLGIITNTNSFDDILNNTNLVVEKGEAPILIVTEKPSRFNTQVSTKHYLWKLGSGNFSPIGSNDIQSKLELINEKFLGETEILEIINNPTVEEIPLEVITEDFITYMNNNGSYGLTDNQKTYIITFTKDDIDYAYIFQGLLGIYGVGFPDLNIEDFIFVYKSTNTGEPTNSTYIRITRAEAEVLQATASFVPGATYTITDADPNLYGGTEITLTAITENQLSLQGSGLFYCPKYDLNTPGYGIWTTYMEGAFVGVSGNFQPNELVVANNSATAIYLAEGFLNYVSGDWSTATSIQGQTSLVETNISGFTSPSYNIGQIVHWGGKSWINKSGSVGSSIDKYTLDEEWEEIPFNETDYNVYIDDIHYDFGNDMIIYRKDRYNNVVSGSNQVFVEFESPDGWGFGNPIKDFQWGCAQDDFNTNDYLYIGIQGNQVIDSYFETLNTRAKYIWFSELSQFDYIDKDTLSNSYLLRFSRKLDKVTTSGVERVYIINADGSQGTKATSDFGTVKATITVELISQLTTDFYAPNALRINSTALISGSGTLTLKVNDVAYTLTDLIPQGAKITAETTSSSVYNLISIYE